MSVKKAFVAHNLCGGNFSAMQLSLDFFVKKKYGIFGVKNRKCSKIMFFDKIIKNKSEPIKVIVLNVSLQNFCSVLGISIKPTEM